MLWMILLYGQISDKVKIAVESLFFLFFVFLDCFEHGLLQFPEISTFSIILHKSTVEKDEKRVQTSGLKGKGFKFV